MIARPVSATVCPAVHGTAVAVCGPETHSMLPDRMPRGAKAIKIEKKGGGGNTRGGGEG